MCTPEESEISQAKCHFQEHHFRMQSVLAAAHRYFWQWNVFSKIVFLWESVPSESDHELCYSHDISPTVKKYWYWEQAVQKYLWFSLSPYVVERACQILGVHMLSFSTSSNHTHLTTVLVSMNTIIWKNKLVIQLIFEFWISFQHQAKNGHEAEHYRRRFKWGCSATSLFTEDTWFSEKLLTA